MNTVYKRTEKADASPMLATTALKETSWRIIYHDDENRRAIVETFISQSFYRGNSTFSWNLKSKL